MGIAEKVKDAITRNLFGYIDERDAEHVMNNTDIVEDVVKVVESEVARQVAVQMADEKANAK